MTFEQISTEPEEKISKSNQKNRDLYYEQELWTGQSTREC